MRREQRLWAVGISLCAVFVLTAMLSALRTTRNANLSGYLGALAIPTTAAIAIGLYVGLVLKRPVDAADRDSIRADMAQKRPRRQWMVETGMAILPGLWIGLVSDSPSAVAVAFIVTWILIAKIVALLDPRPADDPLRTRATPMDRVQRLAFLLLSALIGRLVQLYWNG